MANPEVIQLIPPIGGLNRANSYQQQRPYTFFKGKNVRGFDVLDGMGRIGQRGGLVKQFQEQLGILKTGTTGTTNASPGTTFDDSAVADWSVLGIVAGVDTIEIVNGINQEPGFYAITAVAAGSLTLSPSPGASGSVITYKIGRPEIRLASVIRTFNATGTTSFFDDFNGAAMDATNWSEVGGTLSFPAVQSGVAVVEQNTNVTRGAVLAGRTDVSTTTLREASMVVDNIVSEETKRYRIMLDTRANADIFTNGIGATLKLIHGAPTLELRVGRNIVFGPISLVLPAASTTLRLSIDSGKTIRVYWTNAFTPDITYSDPAYVATYALAAFTLFAGDATTTPAYALSFALSYTSTAGGTPPEASVFSANHLFYREATSGALALVTSSVNLGIGTRIFAASRLDRLYIADYELRDSGTDGKVNGTSFDDAAGQNWTTLGINTATDVLEVLTVGTGTVARVGVYAITTVAAGSLTLTLSAGGDGTNAAVKYRIVRYPKVYDAAANTLTRMTIGAVQASPLVVSQAPVGCRSVVLWSDRLVWCNDPNAPHVWYMSAVGYPLLYDYGDTGLVGENGLTTDSPLLTLGSAAAVTDTQREFAGSIGEPLVTTIPINDDLLVFACKTSFYYLRGNPLDGGKLNNISRAVGIVGIGAWCLTDDGRLLVMTPKGLYEITLDKATPLSESVLPKELKGLSDDRYEVALAFSLDRREVFISATGREEGTASIHYVYSLLTGAFWPDDHQREHDPTAVVTYQPGGTGVPTVLWGGRDGYVRRSEDAAAEDDEIPLSEANVFIGPIRLGRNDMEEGIVPELVGTLDAASGAALGRVYVGDSPQEALASTAAYEFLLRPGHNYDEPVHARGSVAYIEVRDPPWIAPGLITPSSTTANPTAAQLLADLQSCTPLPKYHYAFAYVALATSDPLMYEYIRLSRAYGVSGLFATQAEINAIIPICKAVNLATPTDLPVTWSLNYNPWPISSVGTDPATGTPLSHAAQMDIMAKTTAPKGHFQNVKDWLATANTANGTSIAITHILFDTETYNWKPSGMAGAAAWNAAIDARYQQCYDAARGLFPSASIQWFNRGMEETDASANRSEFVPSVTGWMGPPWFTLNEPGDAFSSALYTLPEYALMRETQRRSLLLAQQYGDSLVTPWVALASGFQRWSSPSLFHLWVEDWDYDIAYSAAFGQEINRPFYGTKPVRYAPWDAATIVVFYPQPFQAASPAWGKHFVAYCRGAAGDYEISYAPWVLDSMAMRRQIVGRLRKS